MILLIKRHLPFPNQIEAAKRWTMWEMMTAHLIQNNDNIKRGEDDKFSLASPLTSIFFCWYHYIIPTPFLSPTQCAHFFSAFILIFSFVQRLRIICPSRDLYKIKLFIRSILVNKQSLYNYNFETYAIMLINRCNRWLQKSAVTLYLKFICNIFLSKAGLMFL